MSVSGFNKPVAPSGGATYQNYKFTGSADITLSTAGLYEVNAFLTNGKKTGVVIDGSHVESGSLEVLPSGTSKIVASNAWYWNTTTGVTAYNVSPGGYYAGAYGDGKYVIGNGGGIVYSTDGITWTSRTVTSSTILTITYAKNIFVAGGSGGVLSTSTDAITWTTRTFGVGSNINCIAFGADTFIAVGPNSMIRTSTDAITWTSRTTPGGTNILSVAYSNEQGYFTLGVTDGNIYTSTNAINWRSFSSDAVDIAGTDVYVASGNGTTVLITNSTASSTKGRYSTDGISWSRLIFPDSSSVKANDLPISTSRVIFLGGVFIATTTSLSTGTRVSTDGITWGLGYNLSTAYSVNGLTYGNGKIITFDSASTRTVFAEPSKFQIQLSLLNKGAVTTLS